MWSSVKGVTVYTGFFTSLHGIYLITLQNLEQRLQPDGRGRQRTTSHDDRTGSVHMDTLMHSLGRRVVQLLWRLDPYYRVARSHSDAHEKA